MTNSKKSKLGAGSAESPPIDIVSRIQRAELSLSRAERKVASTILRDLEAATHLTVAELSALAQVSEPTVTRFCRSLGMATFREFRLQLARTLAVASAYMTSTRKFDGEIGNIAQSVMTNAGNAIRDGLDQIDLSALSAAVAALVDSRRIEIYGQGGGSAVMAEDARLRLFRVGKPVAAYSDGVQQCMSASTLRPGDAAFAISNSGRSQCVIDAIEIARSFGATTIAITRGGSPLAEAAEIVMSVTIAESDDVFRPTPSRYAHMAIVDTITACVAAQLGAQSLEALRRVRYTLVRLGVAIPTPTSHHELMEDLRSRR